MISSASSSVQLICCCCYNRWWCRGGSAPPDLPCWRAFGRREISSASPVQSLDSNDNDLRELFYCRNPGDARVKVGSDREAASSPDAANAGVDEIGTLAIGFLSAGALQNWPC